MRARLLPILVLTLLGCGEGGGVFDPNSVAGTYMLTSVQGQPLPYIVSAGPPRTELTRNVLTVTTSNGWSESASYTSIAPNGQSTVQSIAEGGYVVRSGLQSVAFIRADGSVSYSGTFLGLSMKLARGGGGYSSLGGVDYVFAR